MNSIVTTYLTTAPDPQLRFLDGEWKTNIVKTPDDPGYILDWYNSIIKTKQNGVILHDQLSAEFIKKFPLVEFIKVNPVPEGIQLYDYRWILYWQYMNEFSPENIFFTDVSDVKVVKNPFEDLLYKKVYIFSGNVEEKGRLVLLGQDSWISKALSNPVLLQLPEFEKILHSKYVMLNCGVFGGHRKVVNLFLRKMVDIITLVQNRPVDITVDMAVFNYVAWKYFLNKMYHGWPVNSVFKQYQNDRTDVWFIHK